MSILSNLKPPPGAKKAAHRVGRGPGSGTGKTAGRGQKGQRARNTVHPWTEGGQMPLQRRLPKRGFRNILSDVVVNVNVGQLDAFDAGSEVTIEALRARGLVKGKFDRVKVLGSGELSKKLTVKAHGFSAGARAKIEKAGGTAEVVSRTTATAASE